MTSSGDVFRRGEVLDGTYEILSVLGAGGMGQVFEAYDRLLKRRVAIKAAWPHADASSVRTEAQALAQLRHPGLVTVHALSRHRGVEYAVMERVHGTSLEAHLAQNGRLSLDEALEALHAIATTLSVVHAAGIAHRDVKPANVILAPKGRVVLVDFGIQIPECNRGSQTVTGSPHYMAPETIADTMRPGDGYLVDVYAFGVMAYELLTGELPYQHASVGKLLRQHVEADVPDVRARRADVPAGLAALILQLMAKNPADRPHSMELTAWELERAAAPARPRPYARAVLA